MIKVQNLTKAIGDSIVIDDLSFEFEKGILGIMTSSKQEKSTLLNILSANDSSFSGNVCYDLLDPQKDSKALKKKIGYLIDGAPVYENMTAGEFLAFIGQAKKIPSEKLYKQIDEALELVELTHKKNFLILNLTKGERKLLSIAQTLIGRPALIILDDPFSDLSAEFLQAAKTIIKMLSDIKPVFIAGISVKDIGELCDAVVIISDGAASFYNDLEEFKKIFTNTVEESEEIKEEEI